MCLCNCDEYQLSNPKNLLGIWTLEIKGISTLATTYAMTDGHVLTLINWSGARFVDTPIWEI